jgi:predicted RNA-binding Zn ribbon-like protein
LEILETLEMRVGMELAKGMSNQQLDEFEAFINKNDEEGALRWLETNFPNYKQVVASQLDKLKSEISQSAPAILAEINKNPQQPETPSTSPQNPTT